MMKMAEENFNQNTWIVQHADEDMRKDAQSGGLFSALAETTYRKHGVVYGAALSEDFRPQYIRTTKRDELRRLQGSKYVQCNAGDIFRHVEIDLNDGKSVLFSGTSCVVKGLIMYLNLKKCNTESLITADIICHGVASPGLWQEHVSLQEKRFGKIDNIVFRDKRFGWRTCMETYTGINGKVHSERIWNDLYFTDAVMRRSCYSCSFINAKEKPSDITMGDYFGTLEDSQFDRTLGVSFAICHSNKGKEILRNSNLILKDSSIDQAMSGNLKHSVVAPKWQDKLWSSYKKSGYEIVLKRFTVYGGILFKIKRKILMSIHLW